MKYGKFVNSYHVYRLYIKRLLSNMYIKIIQCLEKVLLLYYFRNTKALRYGRKFPNSIRRLLRICAVIYLQKKVQL